MSACEDGGGRGPFLILKLKVLTVCKNRPGFLVSHSNTKNHTYSLLPNMLLSRLKI